MVMFIVVDVVGNIFICICLICIEVEVLMFIYSFGICGGDMLNFFVNLFVVEGGVVYIYVWCGLDGNIIFIQQNLVIFNVDEDDLGVYVVIIEGLLGCIVEGVVNVAVSGLFFILVLQVNVQ